MYITEHYFKIMQKSFPFSCIDIIVLNAKNEFLLIKRNIPPYKGKWCLPGGIIKYREKMENALNRIVKDELGITVKIIKNVGFFEKIYPNRHDISHCFLTRLKSTKIKLDFQAIDYKFFSKIPKQISCFHKEMIIQSKIR